jgi:hypothetical protein
VCVCVQFKHCTLIALIALLPMEVYYHPMQISIIESLVDVSLLDFLYAILNIDTRTILYLVLMCRVFLNYAVLTLPFYSLVSISNCGIFILRINSNLPHVLRKLLVLCKSTLLSAISNKNCRFTLSQLDPRLK